MAASLPLSGQAALIGPGARMTTDRKDIATPVGLGLRALKGGAVVVGVAVEGGEPRIVLSTFLATCAEGDRLAFEPYHVAAELKRDPQGRASAEAAAAVAEGRRRQDQLAAKALHGIVRALEEAGSQSVVAALLVNRAGWITDLLEYSVSWPEHVPIAETLAVRDALRFACKECRVEAVELDEKSLPELAAHTLDTSSMAIAARLKALGATVGRPWRKEQKLACLAAWFAMAVRRP
jgi:hypothetical protein